MNKTIIGLLGISVLVTGCRGPQNQEIVKEIYYKYDLPCTKPDWEIRGEDGKIVQLRKDGVSITRSYEQGILHGETSYTFPNASTIAQIDLYENGTLVASQHNYASGIPHTKEHYKNELLTEKTIWYEDGTPSLHELYEEGYLLSGEYRTVLNVVESKVQDGQGTRICRSSEGELLSKDAIKNGELFESVTYFANGDPATITPFEKGQIHGMRLTFLQGGVPQTVEQWENGNQEGLTITYQNGEKLSEAHYHKGKKNGIELRYRDGDLLVEEVNWVKDIQHGPCKYYLDGETKTQWYHQGDIVSRTTFERMNLPE